MWQEDKAHPNSLKWVGTPNYGATIPVSVAEREINRAIYRSDIQNAADRAGITFRVRRELRALESYLHQNEKVLALVVATHRDERGLLVATNDRVIFMYLGWVNKTHLSYDYRRIIKMRWLGGFVMGRTKIYIYKSTASLRFTQVWNPVGQRFIKAVMDNTRNISEAARSTYEEALLLEGIPPHEYQTRRADLLANKIIELDSMFRDGLIAREEYFSQKLSLLNQMN